MSKIIKWFLLAVILVLVGGLVYFAVVDVPAPSQPVERVITNDPAAQ